MQLRFQEIGSPVTKDCSGVPARLRDPVPVTCLLPRAPRDADTAAAVGFFYLQVRQVLPHAPSSSSRVVFVPRL